MSFLDWSRRLFRIGAGQRLSTLTETMQQMQNQQPRRRNFTDTLMSLPSTRDQTPSPLSSLYNYQLQWLVGTDTQRQLQGMGQFEPNQILRAHQNLADRIHIVDPEHARVDAPVFHTAPSLGVPMTFTGEIGLHRDGDALMSRHVTVLESEIQRNYKRDREAEGCVVIKLNPDGIAIPQGFPDLLVVDPHGDVKFVEMKRPDGKVSPAQKHWHDKLTEMGHIVEVMRTRNADGT